MHKTKSFKRRCSKNYEVKRHEKINTDVRN